MKGFTDINQSKILLKILSTEGADMCYQYQKDRWVSEPAYKEYPQFEIVMDKRDIPCWSLAALIDILPRFIKFKGDKYYLRFMKEYVEYANDEISITGRCLHTIGNDNLVDACVEMIIKLHEQKIL